MCFRRKVGPIAVGFFLVVSVHVALNDVTAIGDRDNRYAGGMATPAPKAAVSSAPFGLTSYGNSKTLDSSLLSRSVSSEDPVEDYKITYSKCAVSIDNEKEITISDTTEKSSIKIIKLKKHPVDTEPKPNKYFYALGLGSIPKVTIHGPFGKFYTQADILVLESTGRVKTITSKAACIDWIEAVGVGSIKNMAQRDTSTTGTAVCSVMLTDVDKPIKAAFTGIILENFVSKQPLKCLSVASKAYRISETRIKAYSLGGIGARNRVLSQASGELNVPVEGDSIVSAPEIVSIKAKGAPLTPDTIIAGVSKVKVQGGVFKISTINPIKADMVVRRLISSTSIISITGAAKKANGSRVGGKIGIPGNPHLMRIQANGDIVKIKGQDISAIFWAGFSENDPTYSGNVKKIIAGKEGSLQGQVHVADRDITFSPSQGEMDVFTQLQKGTVYIDTNPDSGYWTLTGPAGFSTVSGVGDRLADGSLKELPPGNYTLTCDAIPGYETPQPQTQYLVSASTVSFLPVWQPIPGGTVSIDITPDAGSWLLSGPTGVPSVTGTGDRLGPEALQDLPPGVYTFTCNALQGYLSPAVQSQTLDSGSSVTFLATWTPQSIGADETTITLPGDVDLVLVKIPAGAFMMGRYDGEQDSRGNEDPQHEVTIAYDFYMAKYEVTQEQWEAVMNTTPWSGNAYVLDHPQGPAVYVSWDDINGSGGFLQKLNEHLVSTSQLPATCCLPSEAEWEYACRGSVDGKTNGNITRFYWGDDPNYTEISDYAWWEGNAADVNEMYAHAVGQKRPNSFGLYDMSGNVSEWCQDILHWNYTGAPTDGSAWEDNPDQQKWVQRGAAWSFYSEECRSGNRDYGDPDERRYYSGFRILRSGSEPISRGAIKIDVTPDTGFWTLTGPVGFATATGTGDRLGADALQDLPPGSYTLTCSALSGYLSPAVQSLTLDSGSTITFLATWTPEGSGANEITVTLPGDVDLVMVEIPAGAFKMGQYIDEQGADDTEKPQHDVTIGHGFYIGKYEVTQQQWKALMSTTPWSGEQLATDTPQSPAVLISWDAINGTDGFLAKLNEHLTATNQLPATFRLPSEAEWEYACRGSIDGKTDNQITRFYWGDDLNDIEISNYAWWSGNTFTTNEKYAHPVGEKLPNGFGLFDMSGNAWEWCQDRWHEDYTGAPSDGRAWEDGTSLTRVLRGGNWGEVSSTCRSAHRYYGFQDLEFFPVGFRIARTQP